jgi:hypothetical protein
MTLIIIKSKEVRLKILEGAYYLSNSSRGGRREVE